MTLLHQAGAFLLLLLLLHVAFAEEVFNATAATHASKKANVAEKVTVLKVDDAQFVQMMQRMKEQAYASIFATMASKR